MKEGFENFLGSWFSITSKKKKKKKEETPDERFLSSLVLLSKWLGSELSMGGEKWRRLCFSLGPTRGKSFDGGKFSLKRESVAMKSINLDGSIKSVAFILALTTRHWSEATSYRSGQKINRLGSLWHRLLRTSESEATLPFDRLSYSSFLHLWLLLY